MNSFRLTTVTNTKLIYVHSFQFYHIHVYNDKALAQKSGIITHLLLVTFYMKNYTAIQ